MLRLGSWIIRVVIDELNPILRGWGNRFRTGNAADEVVEIDRRPAWRLRRLPVEREARNPRSGQADQWTRQRLHGLGLHQLTGTIRSSGAG